MSVMTDILARLDQHTIRINVAQQTGDDANTRALSAISTIYQTGLGARVYTDSRVQNLRDELLALLEGLGVALGNQVDAGLRDRLADINGRLDGSNQTAEDMRREIEAEIRAILDLAQGVLDYEIPRIRNEVEAAQEAAASAEVIVDTVAENLRAELDLLEMDTTGFLEAAEAVQIALGGANAARDEAEAAARDALTRAEASQLAQGGANQAREESQAAAQLALARSQAAQLSEGGANLARGEAEAAAAAALQNADLSRTERIASQTARSGAQSARDAAVVARDTATEQAAAASDSAGLATTARNAAQGAATASANSASLAASRASDAQTSAVASETSRLAAQTARGGAESARDTAVTARQGAESAATTATTQAGLATTARNQAGASANAAADHATAAASSANRAGQEASAAETSRLAAVVAQETTLSSVIGASIIPTDFSVRAYWTTSTVGLPSAVGTANANRFADVNGAVIASFAFTSGGQLVAPKATVPGGVRAYRLTARYRILDAVNAAMAFGVAYLAADGTQIGNTFTGTGTRGPILNGAASEILTHTAIVSEFAFPDVQRLSPMADAHSLRIYPRSATGSGTLELYSFTIEDVTAELRAGLFSADAEIARSAAVVARQGAEGAESAASQSAALATQARNQAGGFASAASDSASLAGSRADAAGTSASSSESARQAAVAAQGGAQTARSGAEAARDIAVTSRQDAQSAASTATQQAGLAATARTNAQNSASAAASSASAAAARATDAGSEASAAEASRLSAEIQRNTGPTILADFQDGMSTVTTRRDRSFENIPEHSNLVRNTGNSRFGAHGRWTPNSHGANVLSRAVLPATDRAIRITVDFRIHEISDASELNLTLASFHLDTDFNATNNFHPSVRLGVGFHTLSLVVGANAGEGVDHTSVLMRDPALPFMRAGLRLNESRDCVIHIGRIRLEDVTSEIGSRSSMAAAEIARNDAVVAKEGAEEAQAAAQTSQGLSAQSANQAGQSATAASNSASLAGTRATNAGNSATAADTARQQAQTARAGAEGFRDQASTARDNAETAAATATTQAGLATTARTNAGNSASAASGSASAAAASATTASQQASAAETARQRAETAQGGAETARNSAVAARQTAEEAQAAAQTSASQAATSRTNAGNSATAASNSATLAGTRATNAGTSATAAETARLGAETARDTANSHRSNADIARRDAVLAREGAEGAAAGALSSLNLLSTIGGSGDNLVANGRFEDGERAPGERPALWRQWDSRLRIRAKGSTGSGAVQNAPTPFVMEISSGGYFNAETVIASADEGDVFQVSYRYAAGGSNVSGDVATRVQFQDSSGTTLATHFINASLVNTQWRQTRSGHLVAPAGTAQIAFSGARSNGIASNTLGFMTDISLRKIDPEVLETRAELLLNYLTSAEVGQAVTALQESLVSDLGGNLASVSRAASAIANLSGSVATFENITSVGGRQVAAGIRATSFSNNGGASGSLLELIGDNVIARGTLSAETFVSGLGTNLIQDSEFMDGLENWAGAFDANHNLQIRRPGQSGAHPAWPTLMVDQTGGTTSVAAAFYRPTNNENGQSTWGIAVEPGKRYCVSAQMRLSGSSAVGARCGITWRDAAGNAIPGPTAGAFESTGFPGLSQPDTWKRFHYFATAPAEAVYAEIFFQKQSITSTLANLYIWKPQFEETHAAASLPSPWSPGTTTYIRGGRLINDSIVARHIASQEVRALLGRFASLEAANIRVGAAEIDTLQLAGRSVSTQWSANADRVTINPKQSMDCIIMNMVRIAGNNAGGAINYSLFRGSEYIDGNIISPTPYSQNFVQFVTRTVGAGTHVFRQQYDRDQGWYSQYRTVVLGLYK